MKKKNKVFILGMLFLLIACDEGSIINNKEDFSINESIDFVGKEINLTEIGLKAKIPIDFSIDTNISGRSGHTYFRQIDTTTINLIDFSYIDTITSNLDEIATQIIMSGNIEFLGIDWLTNKKVLINDKVYLLLESKGKAKNTTHYTLCCFTILGKNEFAFVYQYIGNNWNESYRIEAREVIQTLNR